MIKIVENPHEKYFQIMLYVQSKIILPHCAVQCGHEHQRGRKLHAFQPSPKEVNRMHIITQLSNADNVTH